MTSYLEIVHAKLDRAQACIGREKPYDRAATERMLKRLSDKHGTTLEAKAKAFLKIAERKQQ